MVRAREGLHQEGSPERAIASLSREAIEDEDRYLVAALGAGDAAIIEQLYDRHGRGVYSVAVHLLGDPSAAEEVVQETFLKLWRRPDAYRPERGRLQAWLLGVAHHHAIDLLRRRRTERIVDHPVDGGGHEEESWDRSDSTAENTDPLIWVGTMERRQIVQRALAELPAAQRVPIELAYYRGLTQAEIAAALGQPLGTVKTRMRLALQRLRSSLALVREWRGD